MKNIVLMCILFLIAVTSSLADDLSVPEAVEIALADANNYHPTTLQLNNPDLNWNWTLGYYEDLIADCKSIPAATMPEGLMMYDIKFETSSISFHYRVSADLSFFIRCRALYPTVDGVSPYITDAVNEMNMRLDIMYSLDEVTAAWEERWFSFNELGCEPFKDDGIAHVYGYRVFLSIDDHTYEYRMSEDRAVLSVCSYQGASLTLDLSLVEERPFFDIGETIPIQATISNRGSQDTTAPILLTISIPYGLTPTEVTAEGRTVDIVSLVDNLRDNSTMTGMPADTTRVAADGSLLLVAEENDDITMRYVFRLDPLPANATRTFVYSFELIGELAGSYTLSGSATIEDDFSDAVGSKVGA